jgi:hypothetical protein
MFAKPLFIFKLDAANTLVKAGGPRLVQRLRRAKLKSYNEHPVYIFFLPPPNTPCCCILILLKFFYIPTDAQLNCLKNNFKVYIKIDIKRAPTCFGAVTPSSGSALLVLVKVTVVKIAN